MSHLMHPFHTRPGVGPDHHDPADREPADHEPADREPADHEPADRESAEHQPADHESAAESFDLPAGEAGVDRASEPDAEADAQGINATQDPTPEDPDNLDPGSPETGSGDGSTRRAGQTTVADEVIEKVASIAVRRVPGVHDAGGGTRGIAVTLTGRAATIKVVLTVTYGRPVYQVADQVREELADAVERMLGIEVTRVDVVVEDIHLPEDAR